MRRLRSGFTLLETVIGLAIVCAMALIATWNLKDYQINVEEKQAVEWFKNNFKTAFNYAYLNNNAATLNVNAESNRLVFTYNRNVGNRSIKLKRVFPKTLQIWSNETQYTISNDGRARGNVVIDFTSTKTGHKYSYEIQMGWGELIETKT